MDKSWMNSDARHIKAYLRGVNDFMAFAFRNSAGYTTWNLHRETSSSYVNTDNGDGVELVEESSEEDDISALLRDLACGLDDRGDFDHNSSVELPKELVDLQKLVEANSQELFPNCKKYTKLRFLIRLLHIKLLGGWTDRSFDLILDLFNDVLPESSTPEGPIDEAHNVPRHEEYDNYVEMQESLPPSRPIVAQSARNITTAPSDIQQPYFANDTHAAIEQSMLPPRLTTARSSINMSIAQTNDILPRFANDTHAGTDESLLPYRPDATHSPIKK
uniref:Uncharacterized protein n=1 Tax=Oryza brachyantha TaxID=4533 RepID=J3L5B7_ORYBR